MKKINKKVKIKALNKVNMTFLKKIFLRLSEIHKKLE